MSVNSLFNQISSVLNATQNGNSNLQNRPLFNTGANNTGQTVSPQQIIMELFKVMIQMLQMMMGGGTTYPTPVPTPPPPPPPVIYPPPLPPPPIYPPPPPPVIYPPPPPDCMTPTPAPTPPVPTPAPTPTVPTPAPTPAYDPTVYIGPNADLIGNLNNVVDSIYGHGTLEESAEHWKHQLQFGTASHMDLIEAAYGDAAQEEAHWQSLVDQIMGIPGMTLEVAQQSATNTYYTRVTDQVKQALLGDGNFADGQNWVQMAKENGWTALQLAQEINAYHSHPSQGNVTSMFSEGNQQAHWNNYTEEYMAYMFDSFGLDGEYDHEQVMRHVNQHRTDASHELETSIAFANLYAEQQRADSPTSAVIERQITEKILQTMLGPTYNPADLTAWVNFATDPATGQVDTDKLMDSIYGYEAFIQQGGVLHLADGWDLTEFQ